MDMIEVPQPPVAEALLPLDADALHWAPVQPHIEISLVSVRRAADAPRDWAFLPDPLD